MPRAIRHTAIASVLIPLLAACWESDRTSAASTSDTPTSGSTATVSTGATPSATTESGTASGKRRGRYGGADLRRRGAGVPPRPLRGGGQHVRSVLREQSRQRLGPLHAGPVGVEDRRSYPRARGVRRGAPARARAPEEPPELRPGAARDEPPAGRARSGGARARDRTALGRGPQAGGAGALRARPDRRGDRRLPARPRDRRPRRVGDEQPRLHLHPAGPERRRVASVGARGGAPGQRARVPEQLRDGARARGALRVRPRRVPGGARGRQHLRQGRDRARAGERPRRRVGQHDGGRRRAVAGVSGGDRAVAGAHRDRGFHADGLDDHAFRRDGARFGDSRARSRAERRGHATRMPPFVPAPVGRPTPTVP